MGAHDYRGKRKKGSGQFAAFPAMVHDSVAYENLNANAVMLLHDLARQYNGSNNGDLCCSWAIMKRSRRWKSKATLYKAQRMLVTNGFIELTRQGGLKLGPSLYALTYRPINEFPDSKKWKLDVEPRRTPSHLWKKVGSTGTPAEPQKLRLVQQRGQSQRLRSAHGTEAVSK